jgi:hypothetical protein
MSRRLLVINVMLGLFCLAFAIGIVRALLVKRPLPAAAATSAAVASGPPGASTPSKVDPATYASITTQNLFNPGRSETVTAAAAAVKPILHGIVIESSKSRAFLEDPSVKGVAGYAVGDPIAGGTLRKITDDRVVIARPEGLVEVLLQDPAKPRPAPAAPSIAPVPAGASGQPVPGQQGAPPAPGQVGQAQGAPGPVVLPPARIAPVQAVVTPAHDQVLGQVMPPPVLGNQLSAFPPQSPGQRANE